MRKQILLVDDEPAVLEGLQRALHAMRNVWEITTVAGGEAALTLLSQRAFDVVVSDLHMPGVNGADVLSAVLRSSPKTVRIVLSGQTDRDLILKSMGNTHQFLSKPCDTETIRNTITRACALQDLPTDESLRRLVSQIHTLPSLPELYAKLVEELRSEEPSLGALGEITSQDMGMTAKVLQIINSAFFGIPQKVADPRLAISLLGLETMRALVFSAFVFSEFDRETLRNFPLTAVWTHSISTGSLAQAIAQAEKLSKRDCGYALMGGLLHDCGQLILASNLADPYRDCLSMARNESLPVAKAEKQFLGSTHADIGAYLLGLWGLPEPIVEAVAFHHDPARCLGQVFRPMTAVHVANTLEHEAGGSPLAGPPSPVNPAYLREIRMEEHLAQWRQLATGSAHRR